jgi:hypothetical protein
MTFIQYCFPDQHTDKWITTPEATSYIKANNKCKNVIYLK